VFATTGFIIEDEHKHFIKWLSEKCETKSLTDDWIFVG